MANEREKWQMALGGTILLHRERLGLSHVGLARELGRDGDKGSAATVTRWESGNGAAPDAWDIVRLARIFGIDHDDLLKPTPISDREYHLMRRSARQKSKAATLATQPRPERAAAALQVVRNRLPDIEAGASALRHNRSAQADPSARRSAKSPAPAKRG